MDSPKNQTKYIIHPKIQKEELPKSKNIFLNFKQKPALENFTLYTIVGDTEFKQKYYNEKSPKSPKQLISDKQTLNNTIDETYNTTFCSLQRKIQNKTLTSKLSLDKQLQVTHDERTMTQAKIYKNRDKKIDSYLKVKSNKGKFHDTITFGSVQQIYSHPNPEQIDLINNNIPEFWKNSLRDNQKRLKRHIRGNTFKQQIAQEMLQTLKGRKMLQSTMPKIKDQYIPKPCSKMISPNLRKNRMRGFSLKAKSVVRDRQSASNITMDVPRKLFDQIHKIQYDSGHKWKAVEI